MAWGDHAGHRSAEKFAFTVRDPANRAKLNASPSASAWRCTTSSTKWISKLTASATPNLRDDGARDGQ